MRSVGECVRLEQKPAGRVNMVGGAFGHEGEGGGVQGAKEALGLVNMGCLDLEGSEFLLVSAT